jgi:hypothetical protein
VTAVTGFLIRGHSRARIYRKNLSLPVTPPRDIPSGLAMKAQPNDFPTTNAAGASRFFEPMTRQVVGEGNCIANSAVLVMGVVRPGLEQFFARGPFLQISLLVIAVVTYYTSNT